MALRRSLFLVPLLLLLGATGADAYIGPGAGFAVLSSFLVLLVSFLMALASLVVWPIRFLIRWIKSRGRPRGAVDKVVIRNPVPQHMRYVGDSAFAAGAAIEFSLDGNAFAAPAALTVTEADGSRRPARAEEYLAIRWVLSRPMGPNESWLVRYRAAVL